MRHPESAVDGSTSVIDNAVKALTSLHDDLIARPSEAVPRARQVIDLQRVISEQHPDRLQPLLASTLDRFAFALGELGKPVEALGPIIEAISIYRSLSAQGSNGFYDANLASSLSDYADHLLAAGRTGEALKPIGEAVDVWRTLAKRDGGHQYNARLALCVYRHGLFLDEDGRPSEALQPGLEAVNLYRSLAKEDASAYMYRLADALYAFARYLDRHGSTRQALSPIEEAIDIARSIIKGADDGANKQTSNLALWLHMYATLLSRDGHPRKALRPNSESVDLYRSLTKQDAHKYYPCLADGLHDHARFLRRVGSVALLLSGEGRRGNAEGLLEETIRIREMIATREPGNYTLAQLIRDTKNDLHRVQLGLDLKSV